MKKYIITCLAGMLAATAMAQETYENAQIMTEDLNGTARYVGMGGAMEALGADISTIGTNPAGIGLFRRSWFGVSAGVTVQKGDNNNSLLEVKQKNGKTNMDLNQLGVVFTLPTEGNSFFNMAFNYSKDRNFNQVMSAVNSLKGASLNGISYTRVASIRPEKLWHHTKDSRYEYVSLADEMNYQIMGAGMEGYDADGNWCDGYSASDIYFLKNDNSGWVSNFDFNLSGNIKDRVFLGLTVGLKDVRYRNYTLYDERLVTPTGDPRGEYSFDSDRKITGSGVNFKIGAIFRPVEDSPFRIGAYIHSPTWYSLHCYGVMGGKVNAPGFFDKDYLGGEAAFDFDYNYKIVTPWKFGVSAGTTFGNYLAIGATYDYSDYSSTKNRIDEGGYYESNYWYDEYFETSSSDNQMDRNTEFVLKGVSTLKLGMEVKPVPEVAIRVGYNYVSPMYNENGSKDLFMDANPQYGSKGSYYSTYDYTNWKSTNRVTFGLGFMLNKNWNLDLSYVYSSQKGEAHPFQSVSGITTYKTNDKTHVSAVDEVVTMCGTPTKVNNNRHQINATISYRF